jgi:hypothetical protein
MRCRKFKLFSPREPTPEEIESAIISLKKAMISKSGKDCVRCCVLLEHIRQVVSGALKLPEHKITLENLKALCLYYEM